MPTRSITRFSAALLLFALASCGSTSTGATPDSTVPVSSAPASTTQGTDDVAGPITVMAATSLTTAFTDIATAFTALHPAARVTFSFGGSSSLATSIVGGAPADVFASADSKNMDKVVAASATSGDPTVFTTNSLSIVVQPGNPKGISSLADLARQGVTVATCTDEVPIRRYTDQVLAAAGVTANFVTFEANVGGIVTKVTTGAVDAGIVYRTDVLAAGSSAKGVSIPTSVNVTAEYPIAALAGSGNARTAQAFVDFVQSAEAQTILASYGFGEG